VIAPLLLAIGSMLAMPGALAQDLRGLPCGDADATCAAQALRQHAASRTDTWKAALSVPVGERIGAAPPVLVEYINLDNILNGYPERPRAARLDAALLADLRGAIADLPPKLWARFADRLVGLYFVEGLGGTGYTDYVHDASGKPVAAFVVFDAAVLATQTANAWATWKESTPFKPDPGYRLEARIEAEGQDNRRNALQYILLHELGHVLSVGTDLHPPWNLSPKEVRPGAKHPFFDLSWQIDRKADKYRSRFDAGFAQRARTTYYFGAKLAASEMRATYANLRGTNFPSLYAATSPGDDFAESFASYVHVVLLKRPWQVTLFRNGSAPALFGPCWGEARCSRKQAMLERLLTTSQ
jgi:hypothetical protein